MDIKQAIELIAGEHCYSVNDLRYNQKIGVMYSKDEFNEFLAFKSPPLATICSTSATVIVL